MILLAITGARFSRGSDPAQKHVIRMRDFGIEFSVNEPSTNAYNHPQGRVKEKNPTKKLERLTKYSNGLEMILGRVK